MLPKALLQRADPPDPPRGGGQLCDGQVLVCGAFDEFDGSADLARHGRPVIRLACLYGMRRHEAAAIIRDRMVSFPRTGVLTRTQAPPRGSGSIRTSVP